MGKRDSQRSKLYTAERFLHHQTWSAEHPQWTLKQAQKYADQVTGSKWWAKRHPRKLNRIPVYAGRGGGTMYHDSYLAIGPGGARIYGPYMTLGVWARQKSVILHELAHYAASTPGHGRRFAQEYIALVQRFLGVDQAKRLKASFDRNGVKWRKKRTGSTPRQAPPQCPACRLFMGATHECPEERLARFAALSDTG